MLERRPNPRPSVDAALHADASSLALRGEACHPAAPLTLLTFSTPIVMSKKRREPDARTHLIQMTKSDAGYEVVVGSQRFSLPSDSEILENAVRICGEYDSPESQSAQILGRCSITLELVSEQDVYENRIGVVVHAGERDANALANDGELYADVMSAIGEACPSIECDRVQIAE